jgi:transglutaminase-like putative cysteine protease
MSHLWLHASCEFTFAVAIPTPMVFMLRPRSGPYQWVAAEAYDIEPFVPVLEYGDGFGNLCQRLVAPVGDFRVRTSADVRVLASGLPPANPNYIEVQELPSSVLRYLLPSRYCESDRFNDMAQQIAGQLAPGYEQVMAISEWVRANIRYTPLSSTFPVSAAEVNQRAEGVCRDLAHVGIALCRALCIPARLAVGYLHELDPMDNHAWFEAYVGGEWIAVDPTASSQTGWRITVAYGRDAADVALYNQYGPLLLPTELHVSVERQERSEHS